LIRNKQEGKKNRKEDNITRYVSIHKEDIPHRYKKRLTRTGRRNKVLFKKSDELKTYST